jgi:hypothetical protein
MQTSLYKVQPHWSEGQIAYNQGPFQADASRVVKPDTGEYTTGIVGRVYTAYQGDRQKAQIGGSDQIIGISFDKDRYIAALQEPVNPMVFAKGQEGYFMSVGRIVVRFAEGDVPDGTQEIKYKTDTGELSLAGESFPDYALIKFIEHDVDTGLTVLEIKL